MTTDLERIARAIYTQHVRQTNPLFQGDMLSSWQVLPEGGKADFIGTARAAIEAIRVMPVTDEMIEAAIYCDHDGTTGGKIEAQFRAMCDVILKGEG